VLTDEAFFERAVGRMRSVMLWLSLGGALAAGLLGGWQWGLGFLAGGLASYGNFHWLHRLTASIGATTRGPRKQMVVFFCLRYLLLGLGGYVIVKIFGLNLVAALLGLFTAAAAVLVEILYELFYARA
jgi:hypothetical protein